jgi:hypothetical protein
MPTAVPPIGFSATMTVGGTALTFPVSITVPTGDVGKVEISYMGMPTKDRRYIPTLNDNGVFQAETLYCEADFRALWALRGIAGTAVVITFPDDGTGTPPTFSFAGFLTKAPLKFEMEGVPHISFEMQVSGAITVG